MPEIGKKLTSSLDWNQIFDDKVFRKEFEESVLPEYIQTCRWFAGKSSTIIHVRIQHILPIDSRLDRYYILIVETQFKEAFSHQYLLPIAFLKENSDDLKEINFITRLRQVSGEGKVYDALYLQEFRSLIFDHIIHNKKVGENEGKLTFEKDDSFDWMGDSNTQSEILKADQSNTAIIYQDKYFFKLFRRIFPESNPDLEISKFLKQNQFTHTASYLGNISWIRPDKPPISFGLLQEKLINDGDAWPWMLKQLKLFFENVDQNPKLDFLFQAQDSHFDPINPKSLSTDTIQSLPNGMVKSIVLLGKRTAQMHLTLASNPSLVDFSPTPFNTDYSVWLRNKVNFLFDQRIGLLEKNINKLMGLARAYGHTFLEKRNEVLEEILGFEATKLFSMRTRVHGDYHLGQVLMRDGDFYIMDFEGEPESTIRDRKVKQSPLKDVAGMLRSFHYVIYATLFDESKTWKRPQEEQFEIAERLYQLISGLYMHGYINEAINGSLDIGYKPEIHYLLRYHILEKAVYELGYELNSRPSWAIIPLRGIMKIMGYA